jgi:hypothetical protein
MREYTSAPAEGEANPLAGLEFRLDGQLFRCEGDLSILEVAELARVAATGGEMEEAAKLGLIAEQLRAAFGDAEYARFRAHCREHKTANSVLLTILADINAEVQAVVERETGRPTMPPSPSGTGEPETDERTSRIINMTTGDVTVVPLRKQDAQLEAPTVRPRRPPQDRQPKRRRTG